ncbi:ATP-dependent DNA ligase [Candidatus Woesearchaeota archaeon]|nr:ATP-dependent DNA ligase [Candidatus Woesearchaeota archaeon]
MKFAQFAAICEKLERTSSYIEMKKTLAQFFKNADKKDVKRAAYLLLGTIEPSYSDINLGIAENMALRSLENAFDVKNIKAASRKTGDIGETAEQYAHSKPSLTIPEVFDTLHKIAAASGQGSQDKKVNLLSSLFKKCSAIEARYLARLCLGQLRLGVGDKTILEALADAFADKSAKKDLEHAFTIRPDIGTIAQTLADKGINAVRRIGVQVGTPIQMMLCQRIENLEELKQRTGFPVAVETKYDGERIQAHKKGKIITLFSRRLENITKQFPEITEALLKLTGDFIVEGEAVAVDANGGILPFQTMMQRRRKHNVEEYSKKIPVALKLFDCLYFNSKTLMSKSYPERYTALAKLLKKGKTLQLADRTLCSNSSCADEFFQNIVVGGGEGIVIKSLKADSSYQAGVRGWHWIKWKPEYVKGMRDTFDLVVVGAYFGRGRRAGKYGALLCAAYDDKNDKFETFCKLGTGFKDTDLAHFFKLLKRTDTKPALVNCSTAMEPDVWVVPEIVVEVAGAEITKSPTHTTGYALRFPRFLRIREKKPEQATSVKEIKKMIN